MLLDGHIHTYSGEKDVKEFVRRLEQAGVDGGIVMSVAPPTFALWAGPTPPEERLEDVMAVTSVSPHLFPFYWIDPMEPDAPRQVEAAVGRGIVGFKIICQAYLPSYPRAMDTYRQIAAHGKPILFHSGILADTTHSSRYNRPVEFECLLAVDGLRFALAHLSWPWCDELIAVYCKFSGVRKESPSVTSEMFIDLTPGTPPIYRRDALTKLFTVGCDVENNVFFGSDRGVNDYDSAGVREVINRDTAIFDELRLSDAQKEKVFGENLVRFVQGSSPTR